MSRRSLGKTARAFNWNEQEHLPSTKDWNWTLNRGIQEAETLRFGDPEVVNSDFNPVEYTGEVS